MKKRCYAGGIVGFNQAGDIEECINHAEIIAEDSSAAGISGVNFSGRIKKCQNNGKITSQGKGHNGPGTGLYSAGICSFIINDEIVECINTGDIEGLDTIGGIVGMVYNESNSIILIEKCINQGNVKGNVKCGGIIGASEISKIEVKECKNTGNVKGYTDIAGIAYSIGNESVLENCINEGILEQNYGVVGGITAVSDGKIKNVSNTGDIYIIEGDACAGGIVGGNYGSIESAYNSGKINSVDSMNSFMGGIVGINESENDVVKYSYNKGIITGGGSVGGIIGENLVGTVEECFYYSDTLTKGVGSQDTDVAGETDKVDDNINSYEEFLTWIETKK